MRNLRDDVYGSIVLDDELLEELIDSRAVQRLKLVTQAGASSLVREGRSVTRYEHSVGVMLLTRMLGGSVTEQAAGLLQDVSHTAFSHTIDYVFDDRREEFHERIFEAVVEKSDVPGILANYGLTWRQLFRSDNLKRVDVPAPMLCADRIDYTLRDLVRFGRIQVTEARAFADSQELRYDKIVVTSQGQAWDFVQC